MTLETITTELRQLLGEIALPLRMTVEKARRIGELLYQARPHKPYGTWKPYLQSLGLNERTANDYIHGYLGWLESKKRPAADSLKGLLQDRRKGKRVEHAQTREKTRQALAALTGGLPAHIRLEEANCRRFEWPEDIRVIVADPPWAKMSDYEWLGKLAVEKLRPGGFLLAYAGQHYLPRVLKILTSRAELRYRWTCAMVYADTQKVSGNGGIRACWKPILVFSKGRVRTCTTMADVYTVKTMRPDKVDRKSLHEWQQPLQPIRYWLDRLTQDQGNVLVAEPWAGSGTTAIASLELGLRYCGTERHKPTWKVARGRILQALQEQEAVDKA